MLVTMVLALNSITVAGGGGGGGRRGRGDGRGGRESRGETGTDRGMKDRVNRQRYKY